MLSVKLWLLKIIWKSPTVKFQVTGLVEVSQFAFTVQVNVRSEGNGRIRSSFESA